MAMSVLLQDDISMLSPGARQAHDRGVLSDAVHADDTLVISVSDAHLAKYLHVL